MIVHGGARPIPIPGRTPDINAHPNSTSPAPAKGEKSCSAQTIAKELGLKVEQPASYDAVLDAAIQKYRDALYRRCDDAYKAKRRAA